MKRFAILLAALALSACSSTTQSKTPTGPHQTALVARVDAIQVAITKWKAASNLTEVKTDAEAARNLVVGPRGPGYGDTNGDGTIAGATSIGLLPGSRGEPGLADASPVSSCVTEDVLGGSWSDPSKRWEQALTAVKNWTQSNNTFPGLQSQPQRIFGWASLALTSTNLSDAVGYASDAQLHIDVSRMAVAHCS